MNTKKKTLAVLFGGHSSEYEVSLQSAAAVLEAVDTEQFDPLPIGIAKDGDWYHYLGTYSAIAAGTWVDDPMLLRLLAEPRCAGVLGTPQWQVDAAANRSRLPRAAWEERRGRHGAGAF